MRYLYDLDVNVRIPRLMLTRLTVLFVKVLRILTSDDWQWFMLIDTMIVMIETKLILKTNELNLQRSSENFTFQLPEKVGDA